MPKNVIFICRGPAAGQKRIAEKTHSSEACPKTRFGSDRGRRWRVEEIDAVMVSGCAPPVGDDARAFGTVRTARSDTLRLRNRCGMEAGE